jgi:uncharacterized protein
MRYKLVDEKPKTFVLVFQTNDELAGALKKFATEQKLASASFKAIGALSSVRLGWLNWQTKQYEPSVVLNEQVEIAFYDRRRCLERRCPTSSCPRCSR